MNIDDEIINKVCKAARLSLLDSEKEEIKGQLQDVLKAFSEIEKCDTFDLAPSIHPFPINDSLREDLVKASLSQEDALKNSKHTKDGFFMGPKAI